MTSVLRPAGVAGHSPAPLSHHRRRTNTATSMAATAVTMATTVSMAMGGRGELGDKRTRGFSSWKLIGSETRRCWTWAAAPVT